MPRVGAPELIIILIVVLVLFGAKKLPGLARSIGSSAKEFRKGIEEGMDGEDTEDDQSGQDGSSATTGQAGQAPPPTSD